MSPKMLPQTNILIYDADCRLCVMAKNILDRWDKHKKIEFIPFQDQDASHLLSDLRSISCLDAMRFIDDEGFVLIGLDALRAVLYKLPGRFIFSSIFLLPGTYFLAKKSYSWIARNRYRLFGLSNPMADLIPTVSTGEPVGLTHPYKERS